MVVLGHVVVVATISLARGEWLRCAAEGESCPCAGGLVQYGAFDDDDDDKKRRVVGVRLQPEKSSIACTNNAFGCDPAPRRDKSCRCDTSPPPGASINSVCEGSLTSDGSVIEPNDFEGPRAPLSDAARAVSRAAWVEIPARSSPSYPRKCAAKLGLSPAKNSSRVTIFYGLTLIGDPVCHGFEITRTQLLSMRLAGILPGARFHAFATVLTESPIVESTVRDRCGDANRTSAEAVAELLTLVNDLTDGSATFNVQFENEYEYPALHALWNHARERSPRRENELLLYCHNKGVTHAADGEPMWGSPEKRTIYGYRTLEEMVVFRNFVGAWRYIPPIFDHYDQVEHLSIAPSTLGVGYFNFWWATPAWIRMHDEPSRPSEMAGFERHYFEAWLGHKGIPHELQSNPLPCERGFSIGACEAGFCSEPGAKGAIRYLGHYESILRTEFGEVTPPSFLSSP